MMAPDQDYWRWHPDGGDWSAEDTYLAYRGGQFLDAYEERQAVHAELAVLREEMAALKQARATVRQPQPATRSNATRLSGRVVA